MVPARQRVRWSRIPGRLSADGKHGGYRELWVYSDAVDAGCDAAPIIENEEEPFTIALWVLTQVLTIKTAITNRREPRYTSYPTGASKPLATRPRYTRIAKVAVVSSRV